MPASAAGPRRAPAKKILTIRSAPEPPRHRAGDDFPCEIPGDGNFTAVSATYNRRKSIAFPTARRRSYKTIMVKNFYPLAKGARVCFAALPPPQDPAPGRAQARPGLGEETLPADAPSGPGSVRCDARAQGPSLRVVPQCRAAIFLSHLNRLPMGLCGAPFEIAGFYSF